MSNLTIAGSNLANDIMKINFKNLLSLDNPKLIPRIFRSASLRLACMYVAIFGISTCLLSASLWYSTIALLNRQAESVVHFEAQSMAEQFGKGGFDALSSAIRARLTDDPDSHALYLLVDHDGNRVAGNLDRWPARVTVPHQWYRLPLKRYEIEMQAMYRFYPLPDGYRLLLGRDTRTIVQLRGVLREGLLIAAGAMMVLSVISSILVRKLFAGAMTNLSAVANAISGGDMTGRVKLTGAKDEFDELAGAINGILDLVQKLMDGVRQVTDAVAHDLRTPIARARARLEQALLPETRPEDWLNAIQLSIEDLDKIGTIFQSLLRIAEVEAGARRSAFATINFTVILKNLLELYEGSAEEQNIKLEGHLDNDLRFFGDQQMIQQAVVNLLDNAIKFSPPQSTVTLAASREQGRILISVNDQGRGIPAEDREKAVQRFYRAEAARNTPGSGLGLTLVAAVAELHYGKLRLEDNAPGLRAILDLPCRINKYTRSKASVQPEYVQLRSMAGAEVKSESPASVRC